MFGALPPAQQQALVAACRRRRFDTMETIVQEGAPADALHVLLTGRASVTVTTPQGDSATLAVLSPGSTFGEIGLVLSVARTASVIALEECETLTLHRRAFERLKSTSPVIADYVTCLLATQVCRLTEQLVEALYLPVEQRILRRLADLADVSGTPPPVVVTVTQGMLATMAGTSRVSVNLALQRAQASGLVEVLRGRLVVHDIHALREVWEATPTR